MRSRNVLAALLAIVACGGSPRPLTTGGGTGSGSAVVAPASGDDVPLAMWKDVKKGVLPNGLTYYVLPHHKPEKRAFLWLAVNAGAVLEDDDQRGLAHFDEHMAFNGTKRFPKDAIVNYLQSIGMRFGADLNARTTFDDTMYQLQVPTDNKEFIAKGFEILRDWAGDVSYEPGEVDKERGVVLEEWRLDRNAGMRLFTKHAQALLKGTRYPDRIPIGLPETIKGASRDTLYRFYKDWYRPDLSAVIAVGDFDDPAAIEAQIQKTFGDLKNPDKERPRPQAGVPKADGTRVSIELDKELPNAQIEVANLIPERFQITARDYRREIVQLVFLTILN
ncbi:MAG TPA: pitrilysin family protein, partial [Kofleriaceae bacterium]|nr:pitrilysin family protein [Kofleriaceae bacterium]